MADLRPLSALLYDPQIVRDISNVITPPYDVMSADEQQVYRARSPYSAINLELPVETDGVDRYTHAARLLRQWLDAGVLRPHPRLAMFVHQQKFELAGAVRTRTALLAGVCLEPWQAGVVIPHERTFRGPKQDRLELLRTTQVAPSSIFSLYEQPRGVQSLIERVIATDPLLVATESAVTHSLWSVDDEHDLVTIARSMHNVPLYIADGHHRYETALAYRDERRSFEGPDVDAAYNFIAMSLVAFDDPGLVVLPTHRLVSGLEPHVAAHLRARLGEVFKIEVLPERVASNGQARDLLDTGSEYAFLLYDGVEMLRVTANRDVLVAMPADRSEAWRRLELAVLHELLIGHALGVAPEHTEAHLLYSRDVRQALERVDHGDAQVAILVRPATVKQLRAVADAGDKMPQKSTYFYPKFPAGLVINQLSGVLPTPSGGQY